jgi:hypothetical protein
MSKKATLVMAEKKDEQKTATVQPEPGTATLSQTTGGASNQPPPTGPQQIEVKPVEGVKMEKVKIQETIQRMRYAGTYFQFRKGQEVVVPAGLAKHLREKGFVV